MCPFLRSSDAVDPTHRIWQRKRDALDRIEPGRLHVVAPSEWMADEARRSSLLRRFPISVVPYGLDTDDFAPRDRETARDTLGVPRDARVLLFVAQLATDHRKGFAMLSESLSGLKAFRDLLLISVGVSKPAVDASVPHRHLGHIENDRLLSLVYSAADVFVIPSLQDNLPNTVLEAMACGTPTVGFATGGIPEMVRPGETGLLAQREDVAALRDSIAELLQDTDGRAKISANCRRTAVEQYGLETQARRYVGLYASLLGRTSQPPASPDRPAAALQKSPSA